MAAVLVLNKRNPKTDPVSVLGLGVRDTSGDPLLPDPLRLQVLLVFSPFDCWRCKKEIPVWNKIFQLFGSRMDVVGIVRAPNTMLLRRYLDDSGVRFRIIYDSSYSLSRGLLGPDYMPKSFVFVKAKLIEERQMGIAVGSPEEGELISRIEHEIP